jgi:hypothetical protein
MGLGNSTAAITVLELQHKLQGKECGAPDNQVLAQKRDSSTVRRLEILADNTTWRPMEGENGRGRSALSSDLRMLQGVDMFLTLLGNRDNFREIFEIECLDVLACSRGITV